MIPPRRIPSGVIQLVEISDTEKTLIFELPSSTTNRIRIQSMRNNMLMYDPTKNLVISENNAWK